MLLFALLDAPDALDAVAERGLRAPRGERVALYTTLDGATANAPPEARVLVVDAACLSEFPHRASAHRVDVAHVPPEAIQNIRPYRPPVAVQAGGGYVARVLGPGWDASSSAQTHAAALSDVAVLLIFRRGVWDVPKGKQDPGESVEACALREVREEVGIQDLTIRHPLGHTQHGYVEDDAYTVKTTAWYLMQTPERHFVPETSEGIRRVAWARWPVARAHIGYATLARHMDRVAPTVGQVLHAPDADSPGAASPSLSPPA